MITWTVFPPVTRVKCSLFHITNHSDSHSAILTYKESRFICSGEWRLALRKGGRAWYEVTKSLCRRLKHLSARSSFSLFNCTLLIGKYLHFLIAFDSDCHTEDDFSVFLSWYCWWRVFLQCSAWPFLPCVQLQFCEFIYGIPRSHIILSVPC